MTPGRILHIDLASPDGPPPLPAAGPAFVALWWRTIPLGHVLFETAAPLPPAALLATQVYPSIARTVAAYVGDTSPRKAPARGTDAWVQLQTLARPLDAWSLGPTDLGQAPLPTAPTYEDAAIVIPTRHRPAALEACLASVAALTPRPAEIIVVDDAPTGTASAEVAGRFAGVRWLRGAGAGASAARNQGAAACGAPCVAFLDDDVTVHPGWLAALTCALRHPGTAISTGLVLPATFDTPAQILFERHHSFVRGYAPRTFGTRFYRHTRTRGVPVWEMGGSGNMCVRREVFLRLGGFDERLGAGRAGCSEDSEFFYRALAAGYACRYEPRAVGFHSHRTDLPELERQLHAYMRGHVAALLLQFAHSRDYGNLYRLLWSLPTYYARCYLRRLHRPVATGSPRALRAEVTGCLAGIGYYYRHCRPPRPPLLPHPSA